MFKKRSFSLTNQRDSYKSWPGFLNATTNTKDLTSNRKDSHDQSLHYRCLFSSFYAHIWKCNDLLSILSTLVMGCDSSHSDSVNNPWGNIQKPRTPRKLPPSHHFHLFQESPPHGTTSNNRITDQIVKNKEISESSFRGEFDRAKQHDYKFADVTFPDSS